MTAKKIRRWKFLRDGLKSNYDGHQWVIGEWRKTECVGEKDLKEIGLAEEADADRATESSADSAERREG